MNSAESKIQEQAPGSRRRSWAVMWVALGASLWGTDTVFRRPLTHALSSSQIVLAEHLILTVILLPVLWRTRTQWLRLRRLQWSAVLGIAWGGSALGTVFFTEAVRTGNPTVAVLLQKSQPLFTALLARVLLRERPGRRFWLCLFLAVAGGYLVSFGARMPVRPLLQAEWMAPLFALAAAWVWGSSTVLGRYVLESLSAPAVTALRIVTAVPFLAALVWFRFQPLARPLESSQGWSLLWLALIPGLLALVAYYRGLGRTRASLAAVAELSFPATATLLNWIFLDAQVTPTQVAGFALLWGVILNLDRPTRGEQADGQSRH